MPITATYLLDGYSKKRDKVGYGLSGWYRDLTTKEAKAMAVSYPFGSSSLYAVDQLGNVREVRLNGKPNTWKTRTGCTLSLKYGLRECFTVGSDSLNDEDPISDSTDVRIVVPVTWHNFPPEAPPEAVTQFVLEQLGLESEPTEFKSTSCYQCRHCGEYHASDDTELWCAIARVNKTNPHGVAANNRV